jgi:hypothetical protein
MKFRLSMLFALVFAVAMITASSQSLVAQCGNNDTGVCDTVRLGRVDLPTGNVGDSVGIPVYIWHDEGIGAFTLGFTWNQNAIKITSFAFADTLKQLSWNKQFNKLYADSIPRRYMIGGVNINSTEFDLPATAGPVAELVATVYFKVIQATGPIHVDVDSMFVPKAGVFVLSTGVSVSPQFRGVSFGVPVMEFASSTLPMAYSLGQNVPNPFNPTTSIEFAIPKSGMVTVEVFNVLGQKVKTLVNEDLRAGYKRVDWDGTDDGGSAVASGVYLYRLKVNDFSETKKMLLLK